ncbi:Protein-L-isoaspartate(D-aspartate) O-methyltransferase domain-containing protein [Rozella allomycis CSF55]|uniref:Protein-L-isoaspartate O-methyltransferase n=1 Tax=Rozella allomycis (strain CSF55) TaxID=988480 RepID=A0A075B3E9_ROZAC|nr:Protein-L-isoaspartate(D-aspartate) O-methyltransferase domain-containing protein [Rozella allomycis CSF55]|eukprot:EPZ35496.1 Protein-L-isoaspartate(D-aspartate) O-methyltransferase domain-containing protein [Rozella allomycis CSF55]
MAYFCSGKTNNELIAKLKATGIISNDKVADAMRTVDRAKYCTIHPYHDSPQPIGFNATISAPHMHAIALEVLLPNLKPGAKVLDVGCGSGYLTSCFASLVFLAFIHFQVYPNGKVIGIDHIPELVQLCQYNVNSDHPEYINEGVVHFYEADGREGYANEAPYDVIHVGASSRTAPVALLEQLAVNGLMVIPITHTFTLIHKNEQGKLEEKPLMSVRYVGLTSRDEQIQ